MKPISESVTDSNVVPNAPIAAGERITFRASNPATNHNIEPAFSSSTLQEVENAAKSAAQAFFAFQDVSDARKAEFLRRIAYELNQVSDEIIARAQLETALPPARLEGELKRTMGQCELFAQVLEDGAWLDARIDTADPTRAPLPKPDMRSMLRPLGPVVVFGASNFPLAYSVAGGDTVSALAAGCPVVVKAHAAHPGTSEIVAFAVLRAARHTQMPEHVFALIFDGGLGAGYEVGTALVQSPEICAVGFTGSRAGGVALMKAANARNVPIPVFAEMSSINPIIITHQALAERAEEIANGLHASITQGVGQFCTNPGLIFLPSGDDGDDFLKTLVGKMRDTAQSTMLTAGIAQNYVKGAQQLANHADIQTHLAPSHAVNAVGAGLFETTLREFSRAPELQHELFGPATLVVRFDGRVSLEKMLQRLEGQLTATLQTGADEIAALDELGAILANRAGRVVWNGFPTGVEVGHAIVHGGPFPATSDGRTTSVGSRAITRWTRQVCWQNFPDAALPPALQNANPLKLVRLIDGAATDKSL